MKDSVKYAKQYCSVHHEQLAGFDDISVTSQGRAWTVLRRRRPLTEHETIEAMSVRANHKTKNAHFKVDLRTSFISLWLSTSYWNTQSYLYQLYDLFSNSESWCYTNENDAISFHYF